MLQFCLQLCLESPGIFVFLECLSMLRPAACFCSQLHICKLLEENLGKRDELESASFTVTDCGVLTTALHAW